MEDRVLDYQLKVGRIKQEVYSGINGKEEKLGSSRDIQAKARDDDIVAELETCKAEGHNYNAGL